MITYVSLCSGIEAASAAFGPLGWKALAFSEIEAFPCKVLAHHYPDVPNFGDMRDPLIEWPKADVVCGGTPCQSFSVAGRRDGMNASSGQLTIDFIRICDEIDPRVILWENVPGVLSDKTNGFGNLLAGLCGEGSPLLPSGGKWTNAGYVSGPKRNIAWRILNAEFFGVPQRRRRVFLVGCPGTSGIDPREILFKSSGLRRDFEKSGKAGQETSRNAPESFGGSSGSARGGMVAAATARNGRDDFDSDAFIVMPIQEPNARQSKNQNGIGIGKPGDPMYTLQAGQQHGVAVGFNGRQDPIIYGEKTGTLDSDGGTQVIAFSCKDDGGDAPTNVAPTLRAMNHSKSHANGGGQLAIAFTTKIGGGVAVSEEASQGLRSGKISMVCTGMRVRRILPIEAERLQGFQDDYTNVPGSSSTARYKAIGNSWAVPCITWLGLRIEAALQNLKGDWP